MHCHVDYTADSSYIDQVYCVWVLAFGWKVYFT